MVDIEFMKIKTFDLDNNQQVIYAGTHLKNPVNDGNFWLHHD